MMLTVDSSHLYHINMEGPAAAEQQSYSSSAADVITSSEHADYQHVCGVASPSSLPSAFPFLVLWLSLSYIQFWCM
jgi:hypothetical protein